MSIPTDGYLAETAQVKVEFNIPISEPVTYP